MEAEEREVLGSAVTRLPGGPGRRRKKVPGEEGAERR